MNDKEKKIAWLNGLLKLAIKEDVADIHIAADEHVFFRVKNSLIPIGDKKIDNDFMKAVLIESMTPEIAAEFEELLEIDYSYTHPDLNGNRFRVNVFTASGKVEAVFRLIVNNVRSLEDLSLPHVLQDIAMNHDGLVLIAGSTGSGKSTTLAAMIDYVNKHAQKRIITIENPVEIMHKNKKSLISQREVGADTHSFAAALRSVLRQNPDLILIGEIRDKETADAALRAAQTGHLVFSTIHASSSEETIKRFVNMYPAEERSQLTKTLAVSLRSILSQRLVLDIDGGRRALLEIMISNHRIQQGLFAMSEGVETESITKIIEESGIEHMQTLDQCLIDLLSKGQITLETALDESVNLVVMKQRLQSLGLIKL